MIVPLVARIFVPELNTESSLRVAETPVNRQAIALPETIGLDVQQFNFSIGESDADVERSLGFNVLAYNAPFL